MESNVKALVIQIWVGKVSWLYFLIFLSFFFFFVFFIFIFFFFFSCSFSFFFLLFLFFFFFFFLFLFFLLFWFLGWLDRRMAWRTGVGRRMFVVTLGFGTRFGFGFEVGFEIGFVFRSRRLGGFEGWTFFQFSWWLNKIYC
jgi:hypothetical protein